jgi:hypothetical protein
MINIYENKGMYLVGANEGEGQESHLEEAEIDEEGEEENSAVEGNEEEDEP